MWDGLPAVVAPVLSTGFDVFLAQSLIGGISLLVLWLRWGEARRLQIVQLIQPEPAAAADEDSTEEGD